jgi:hypothetical protein
MADGAGAGASTADEAGGGHGRPWRTGPWVGTAGASMADGAGAGGGRGGGLHGGRGRGRERARRGRVRRGRRWRAALREEIDAREMGLRKVREEIRSRGGLK